MKTAQLLITATLIAATLPMTCRADGLADLKAALAKAQGKAPLHASFEIRTWNREGDDKLTEDRNGQAVIAVEDNVNGLHLEFGRELLNRIESEQHGRQKDHRTPTPTVNAADAINTKAVQEMTSAAATLQAWLEKAEFKAERSEAYNGKPARVLTFTYSQDKLTPKEREHLKSYAGNAEVWIADNGTPLAWHSREVLTASYMLVVSFDISTEENATFSVVGDRLIATRRDLHQSGSGMGQKGQGSVIRSLTVS